MAELSTVARPYAEAVFAVALAQGESALPIWQDWLNALAYMVQDAAVQSQVFAPQQSDPSRLAVFESLLGVLPLQDAAQPDQAQTALRPLLQLLIANDRLVLLPMIATQFELLSHQHHARARALITSAFPLTDSMLSALKSGLEHKFGCTLIPEVTVDPRLIGGVRVQVGDHVLDQSVRAQLEQLRHALA